MGASDNDIESKPESECIARICLLDHLYYCLRELYEHSPLP